MTLSQPSKICNQFALRTDDLVGHDLPPEESARFMDHARNCARCSREWRAALDRSAALQTMTPWALEAAGIRPSVPGSTADAVFARLAAGEGLPTWRERWARPLAMAAAIIVTVGAGVFASGFLNLRPQDSMQSGGQGQAGSITNNSGGNKVNDHINGRHFAGPAAPGTFHVNGNFVIGGADAGAFESDERVVNPEKRKMLLESSVSGFQHRDMNTTNVGMPVMGPFQIVIPMELPTGPVDPRRKH